MAAVVTQRGRQFLLLLLLPRSLILVFVFALAALGGGGTAPMRALVTVLFALKQLSSGTRGNVYNAMLYFTSLAFLQMHMADLL